VLTNQLSPSLSGVCSEKGYLTLPPKWLEENPTFELDMPLKPRFLSPHPYTNQDIIALARGPLIYCVEDFDNPWVEDHFKSLVLDPSGEIEESPLSATEVGEPGIALAVQNAAFFLHVDGTLAPALPSGAIVQKDRGDVETLHFIPYALRDNRGGKGHMRVGIRRKR